MYHGRYHYPSVIRICHLAKAQKIEHTKSNNTFALYFHLDELLSLKARSDIYQKVNIAFP